MQTFKMTPEEAYRLESVKIRYDTDPPSPDSSLQNLSKIVEYIAPVHLEISFSKAIARGFKQSLNPGVLSRLESLILDVPLDQKSYETLKTHCLETSSSLIKFEYLATDRDDGELLKALLKNPHRTLTHLDISLAFCSSISDEFLLTLANVLR